MKNFKESQTYKNLQKAFEGEAKAHLKYQFYKSQLSNTSKELEEILEEIIHNEKEHGKIWFKQLHDGSLPSDADNLYDAIKGELHECNEMYPEFAKTAFDEGFDYIGELFTAVSKIEGRHAKEFESILDSLKEESLFKSDEKTNWICRNCGHVIYDSKEPPAECPICKHPRKYFTRNKE